MSLDEKQKTIDQVRELYNFLQGQNPPSICMPKKHHPKMSSITAFKVIWFLQEHLRVLPDHFERCDNCGELYDSNIEGHHSENEYKKMHFFCDGCLYLVDEKEFQL